MTRDYDHPPQPKDIELLALEYRRPGTPGTGRGLMRRAAVVGRRLCFATGLGMVLGGVGFGWSGGRDEPQLMMGWGGFLVGPCVPLGRWPQE